MEAATAEALLKITNDCKVWSQDLLVLHNGKRINISSAAQGKDSTTPSDAPDQPEYFPSKTKYQFDTKFKGLQSREDIIKMMKHPDTHPGSSLIVRGQKEATNSQRKCTLIFVCNQHRGISVDEECFEDGKLAKSNIKQPTMKKVKTAGTINKGVAAFAKKKDRKHIAHLGDSVGKQPMGTNTSVRRTTSNKTEDPCGMRVIVFLSVVDDFYYLATSSNMTHMNHFELPNRCIPQNSSHLEHDDISIMNNMFNANIPASVISRVLAEKKGRDDTHFDPKTLRNMQAKTQNLIDESLGYTADMNDADKTLMKLKE